MSLAYLSSHSLIVHVSNLCDCGEGTCTGSIMPNGGQNFPLKPKWYVLASMPIRKSVNAASQRVARQSALKLFTDRNHERELLRHFFERLARVHWVHDVRPEKPILSIWGVGGIGKTKTVGESHRRTWPEACRATERLLPAGNIG